MNPTENIHSDKEQLCSQLQQTVCYTSMDNDSGQAEASSESTPTPNARYKVADVLGSGGMGVVLKVFDNNLHRNIAMKVLQKGHVENGESAQRFIREAEITGTLEHPNIVPLHELGLDLGDNLYYTMKEIKGETLQHILKQLKAEDPEYLDAYPLHRLIEIVVKVCHAISLAHNNHVIHRDIKPANIMVGSFGEVLVVDWGLAKKLSTDTPESESPDDTDPDTTAPSFVTQAGAVMGTPGYMAPEQILSRQQLGEQTDIFAVGGVLYAALTLRPPISGKNAREVIANTIKKAVESPGDYLASLSRKDYPKHVPWKRVPASLNAVVTKALERQVSDRYQTVQELIDDLKCYQEGYATAAESASLARQLVLLFGRSKKVMSAIMLVLLGLLAYSTVFSGKLLSDTQQAAREEAIANQRKEEADGRKLSALTQLERVKKHVPNLVGHARFQLENQNVPEALELIERALELDSQPSKYHELRGDILCNLLRFKEATESYDVAVQKTVSSTVSSKQTMARTLSTYSEFDHHKKVQEFYQFLTRSSRHHEALNLLMHMGEDRKKALSSTLAVVGDMYDHFKLAEESNYRYGHKVRVAASALCLTVEEEQAHFDLSLLKHVDARVVRIHNPAVIKGWENLKLQDYYHRLHILNADVFDLNTIKNLKVGQFALEAERVINESQINSLAAKEYQFFNARNSFIPCMEAISQKHIDWLYVTGLEAGQLGILKKFDSIDRLDIGESSIHDLNAFNDVKLEKLTIRHSNLDDLNFKGLSTLSSLTLDSTDVFVLNELDLSNYVLLDISNSKINDLRPLSREHNRKLIKIVLKGCWVKDLSPLRSMAIGSLNISHTPVESLAPLKGMPLSHLYLQETSVSDLTPIAECPLQTIYFNADTITQGLDALRTHKTLRKINGVNVDSFWRNVDSKRLRSE